MQVAVSNDSHARRRTFQLSISRRFPNSAEAEAFWVTVNEVRSLVRECRAGDWSVIWGCSWLRSGALPFAVASYIAAAYWFTASTSSANPAVTIARCLSDTFAGIQPVDVPPSIVAQLTGALPRLSCFGGSFQTFQLTPRKFWCRASRAEEGNQISI